MRIMVVDDDRLNLAISEDYLREMFPETEVYLCKVSTNALKMIHELQIDIVLLDIVMPVLDGIAVLKMIRALPELDYVQVIMLTSLMDSNSFSECFANGADDFLNKPVDILEMKARIQAAIMTRKNAMKLSEAYRDMEIQNHKLSELNAELNAVHLQMIQKEKLASIGELAAGVAHEINNPMGFIRSNLEVLRKYLVKMNTIISSYDNEYANYEFGPEKVLLKQQIKDRLEQIKKDNKYLTITNDVDVLIGESLEGVDRVAKIVSTLRNFARSGTENEFAKYSLEAIVEDALIIVRNEVKYVADVKTAFASVPDIICDKGLLGQVIVNLIINSVQAIKSQKRNDRGEIKVETRVAGDNVILVIEDDGPGIPEEIKSRIFDPFFTTKEVGQGTGLGLSITQDIIINKHKGDIHVSNKDTGGAVFSIRLPINQEDELL